MLDFKSVLIDAYRWATQPIRSIQRQNAISNGKVPVGILFYHRVSDEFVNDWTITEMDFQRQIDWLEKNFDLISLEEAQRRIDSGHNERPSVSITFDDGYADNCNWALPMLIQRNIPLTYFVTTHHVTTGSAFHHDIEAGQRLRSNSIETLRAMARAGVEIGAHTRSHADLGKITDETVLYDEVVTATRELERALEIKIKYFAFPYGQPSNTNRRVLEIAKENGFAGVCSAFQGWNHIGDDSFHLQRFHGDPSLARLKNWLTFDPRRKQVAKDAIRDPQVADNSSRKQTAPLPIVNGQDAPIENSVNQ